MKTAVDASYTTTIPDSTHLSDVLGINAFTAAPQSNRSVIMSPLYRTYCSLYEECKCIGMRVSVSIASQIGGTALPSLQIYTAWDRRHGSTEPVYTAQEIKDSSTYNVATALNNNVAKLTRSLYASDLMEKAQWHDCSITTAAGNYQDAAYEAAGANPNFFAPCLFLAFASPALSQAQSPATVNMSISTVYYFAFRNPKFGAGGTSAKLADLGGVISDGIDPAGGDDGDMDMDVPPAGGLVRAASPPLSAQQVQAAIADAMPDPVPTQRKRRRVIVVDPAQQPANPLN